MMEKSKTQFPVFVMSGSDAKRRKLLEVIDPDEHYHTKALLPFLGKRLIDWQLDALRASPYVEGLYLIGLSEEEISFDFPVHMVPCPTKADVAEKLMAGLAFLDGLGMQPQYIVISSCDTPGIRTEEINLFFEAMIENADCEFIMSLVPEDVAEAEFPCTGRVVAHFRDCNVFPGELYALSPGAIKRNIEFILAMSQRRRQVNRQKAKISMGPVLRYLARTPRLWFLLIGYALGVATMAQAERALSAAFKCKTKAVIIKDAGFGMDMDLPEDYERLKAYVKKRKGIEEG